ncbi:RNase A-like domain-containing protein [Methylocystis hirsuta]|uniref:RNase A-like domain-containing protein n=1 Tax=Methylocystis hirsuta TaxID=369798 RepID=UPI0024795C46|nr:RNase A-like domain-containing protein [Methylocystis hirsuta]
MALERRYSPDQPRVPAGNSGGGQWTGDGGGGDSGGGSLADRALDNELSSGRRTTLAQNQDGRRYSVVLKDEEGYGHTLRDHVNKEDRELMAEVEKERLRFTLPAISIISYSPAEGAFDSWESANDFVNRTLEANRELVDAVAEGRLQSASLKKNFGTRTGKEAFLSSGTAAPVVRNTFWVRVVIHADPMHPKGYRVRTAYPFNQPPSKQLRWRAQ